MELITPWTVEAHWLMSRSCGSFIKPNDLRVVCVLGSQLRPETLQVGTSDGTTRLVNNRSIPSSIVMDIDDAGGTSCKTSTNKLIIYAGVVRIQGTTEVVIDEPLP